MSSTLLDAVAITRHHGARTVLDRVGLRVDATSRIALAGPNGSGKSTLLGVLAGEVTPDGGTVTRQGSVGLLPQLAGTPTDRPARAVALERLGVAGAERALDVATARMTAKPSSANVEAHAAALQRWLDLGADDAHARVDAAVAATGLDPAALDRPLHTLSGGEAARVGLAVLEAARWDVLLLDEPTQHLDAAGLDRLAELLQRRAGFVLVSHDRELLARATDEVVALDPLTGGATHHGGDWASFEAARAADRGRERTAFDQAVTRREALKDAEAEARRRAAAGKRRVGHTPRDNDKNVKEWFASRADGVQRRARVIGARAERGDLPDRPREAPALRLELTAAERGQRWVLVLEQAVVRRGAFTAGPLDLAIERGERIRLTGPNGSGKTTVLEVLAGRREPTAGQRRLAPGAVVGELGQRRTGLDEAMGVATAVRRAAEVDEPEARSALAQMGLPAEVVERAVATLSPGERTRAELALLTLRRTAVLLLDEPTTHLDVEALELLEAALADWPGTLVVATHDQRLSAGLRLEREVSLQADPAARGPAPLA